MRGCVCEWDATARGLTPNAKLSTGNDGGFPEKTNSQPANRKLAVREKLQRGLLNVETELRFRTLGVDLRFALGFLRRSFKRAEAAHFVEDSLGFEFALQALEGAIDGLSFANDDFGHMR